MPASPKGQLIGGDGVMRVITGSSPVNESDGYLFDYLVVNDSSTRVSFLTDVNTTNLESITQWNLGNNIQRVLQPGMIITGKNGAKIIAVTVTVGSVIGYQSRDTGNLRL